MIRSATLAALVALTIAAPARAQDPSVSADGASAMRAAIADGLKRYFVSEEDGAEFRWDGQPLVTPAGDHYDVALPALTVVTDEDTRFDVGTIRLKVAPRPDATYAVEAELPGSMTMLNDGKPAGTLTVGKQRFSGVWSAAIENFVSADLAYGDLALVDSKDKGALRIGSLTATQDMRPDGPGTWSGPVAAALNGVTLTDPGNASLLKVDGIALEASYGRIDLAKVSQFKALAATHAAAGTEPPAAQFLPLLGGMLGEATLRTRVSGLVAGSAGERVALDLATVTLGVRDLDRETSSAVLGFQTDGLTVEPLPGPKQFMPRRVDVQVTLDKVPNAAVGQAVLALAALEEQENARKAAPGKPRGKKAEPEAEGERDRLAQVIGGVVMEAASRAGTELRLDHLTVDTPATAGSVTGAARIASAAAFGVVGGANIVLRGLDAAVEALKPKPGTRPDPETQETLGMLSMLQAMGQQGKDDAGKDVRTYKVEMTESGQFLLNGADMGALLGLGAEPAEPEPEPQPKRGQKKN